MSEIKTSEQLKKLRGILKLTQKEFGERINLTQANISLIEKGEQDVSGKTIDKIKVAFPDLNFNWLHSNKGEPFNDEKEDVKSSLSEDYNSDKNAAHHSSNTQITDELRKEIIQLKENIKWYQKIIDRLTAKS